jgi:STE24 endopeptidase
MKIKILDVFEIDSSKKTVKANAGLVGWGKTRLVILADTLKEKYSPDEIEVILAHEFSHYKLKHLVKLVLIGALTTILCFYLIFKTSAYALSLFNLSSLSDIASLPLVFLYFILFGIVMQPWENYLSRRFEKNADSLAIKSSGLKQAFISTMDKLATQNLADRSPHPIIKLFFFDHPPIDERIKMAESL